MARDFVSVDVEGGMGSPRKMGCRSTFGNPPMRNMKIEPRMDANGEKKSELPTLRRPQSKGWQLKNGAQLEHYSRKFAFIRGSSSKRSG
jgi:hypothetical protein